MKRLQALSLIPLIGTIAVLVGGCGIGNPYGETTREAEAPPADAEAVKKPARDPDAGAPPDEVVLATPQETLRYAASLAGNWEGHGAARAFAKLAALSTGAARAEFARLASESRRDVEEAVGYSRSRASVVAVKVDGEGSFREAIVVTKQRTTSKVGAHPPPEYEVTLATVTRWGKGWSISSWSPQR